MAKTGKFVGIPQGQGAIFSFEAINLVGIDETISAAL
jgi:hypothetical protein